MEILPPDQIDEIINTTLEMIGKSRQEFEDAKWTLLKCEPVWPGYDWQPQSSKDLAAFIDHTLLAPDATDDMVVQLCHEAIEHGFASVCVNSCHVPTCAPILQKNDTPLCAVVGFPLGAVATPAKAAETYYAVDNGAREIDMVLNIGRFKSDVDGLYYAFQDIKAVQDAAWGATVKVILETALLTSEEIVAACVISMVAGATYVKTSTGFSKAGATIEAVHLMREVVGPWLGVKASGGIRDLPTATAMIKAGANRIGSSSGISIVTG